MTPILTLTLAAFLPAGLPANTDKPREPNIFAPSLPQLTDEEEAQLDNKIDHFILQDTGQLRGDDAKQALADFQGLGPDATFALIRGLNRAALINNSCPAVVIAKKLANILRATNDPDLLEFARDNIGLGVTQSQHMGVIRDLRVLCILRKAAVGKNSVALKTKTVPRGFAAMSVADLVQASAKEQGPRLKQILTELDKRNGDEVFTALASASVTYDKDIHDLALDLLNHHLFRQPNEVLKEKLKDDRPVIRAAAARVVASKALPFGNELIDLLSDDDADVRQSAHQALLRLSKGADFGPKGDAGEAERDNAVSQWRDWWARQDGR